MIKYALIGLVLLSAPFAIANDCQYPSNRYSNPEVGKQIYTTMTNCLNSEWRDQQNEYAKGQDYGIAIITENKAFCLTLRPIKGEPISLVKIREQLYHELPNLLHEKFTVRFSGELGEVKFSQNPTCAPGQVTDLQISGTNNKCANFGFESGSSPTTHLNFIHLGKEAAANCSKQLLAARYNSTHPGETLIQNKTLSGKSSFKSSTSRAKTGRQSASHPTGEHNGNPDLPGGSATSANQ